MTKLMPLRRAVVEITNEACTGDDPGIRKAIKSWHNRLANGTIPRTVVTKLGRDLFLDLGAWENWWEKRLESKSISRVGRPRNGR